MSGYLESFAMTIRRRRTRDPERIAFARDQRKQANEFAQDVWQMLRSSSIRGQKFRREHPIGPYTVDFVCLALKLVIEVDGKEHFTEEGKRRDEVRDRFLERRGFEVVRIKGYQVTQDGAAVRRRIEEAVVTRMESQAPHPQPLSPEAGERGVSSSEEPSPSSQRSRERRARVNKQNEP